MMCNYLQSRRVSFAAYPYISTGLKIAHDHARVGVDHRDILDFVRLGSHSERGFQVRSHVNVLRSMPDSASPAGAFMHSNSRVPAGRMTRNNSAPAAKPPTCAI